MPYVEGFGTWPFGEEWLWEAIATSYLPLLDVLDAHPGRVTLSLTPVLCDQLEAPGALERCLAFLREIRPASHRLDIETAEAPVAAALERSAAAYAAAADALERRGDLLAAFAPHATWTSAATHAVLPLLATGTGVRLQLRTGIASHRARFGEWGGGFWLPECAHAPWLDDILEEAGVRVACVDWTDVLGPGPQAPRCTEAGVVLAPLDREAIELVWHRDGYPARRAVPRHAPADRAPPPRVGERRRRLRPRPRRGPGGRRRRGLRAPRGGARRAVGGRARHRAARPLLAGGRRLAARRARGVRAARASSSRRRARASRRTRRPTRR